MWNPYLVCPEPLNSKFWWKYNLSPYCHSFIQKSDNRNQLIYQMAYSTSLIVLTDLPLNIYNISWEKLQINVWKITHTGRFHLRSVQFHWQEKIETHIVCRLVSNNQIFSNSLKGEVQSTNSYAIYLCQ